MSYLVVCSSQALMKLSPTHRRPALPRRGPPHHHPCPPRCRCCSPIRVAGMAGIAIVQLKVDEDVRDIVLQSGSQPPALLSELGVM